MLIIGSALLFAIGLLVLLVQAVRIAFSLLKIGYLLAKLAVYLVVMVVCAVWLGVQWLSQVIADWRWRRRYGEILLPPFDD
jgi:hypothetical protein